MLKIDAYQNITLTRGDSAAFCLKIKDGCGDTYNQRDSDLIRFTVKASTRAAEPLIQKIVEEGNVIFEPADTENLSYGTYFYDVELKTLEGDVFTIIGPCKFTLAEEVTW